MAGVERTRETLDFTVYCRPGLQEYLPAPATHFWPPHPIAVRFPISGEFGYKSWPSSPHLQYVMRSLGLDGILGS